MWDELLAGLALVAAMFCYAVGLAYGEYRSRRERHDSDMTLLHQIMRTADKETRLHVVLHFYQAGRVNLEDIVQLASHYQLPRLEFDAKFAPSRWYWSQASERAERNS